MISVRWVVYLIVAGMLCSAAPCAAAEESYTYSVRHPVYGEIGTLVYGIERSATTKRITSELRVAVSVLGVVVYRYDADSVEVWRGDRLVRLQNRINKNGRRIEVSGEARGDQFMIASEAGVLAASPDVTPPDPWQLKGVGLSNIISTSTGQVLHVQISGGESVIVPIAGTRVLARHYSIDDEKHHEIWLDGHDVPVMFRSVEFGDAVDFILKTPSEGLVQPTVPQAPAPLPDRADR